MGSWAIKWSQRALKDLQALDVPVAQRVVRKLEQAASDPRRFFKRLAGGDDCKLRIGDYRLLAILSHDNRTILVQAVDHRSRVYERRN